MNRLKENIGSFVDEISKNVNLNLDQFEHLDLFHTITSFDQLERLKDEGLIGDFEDCDVFQKKLSYFYLGKARYRKEGKEILAVIVIRNEENLIPLHTFFFDTGIFQPSSAFYIKKHKEMIKYLSTSKSQLQKLISILYADLENFINDTPSISYDDNSKDLKLNFRVGELKNEFLQDKYKVFREYLKQVFSHKAHGFDKSIAYCPEYIFENQTNAKNVALQAIYFDSQFSDNSYHLQLKSILKKFRISVKREPIIISPQLLLEFGVTDLNHYATKEQLYE